LKPFCLLHVLVALLVSTSAVAAETEPYYGWWSPPRDGTHGLDEAINALLQESVRDLNARSDRATLRCEDIAPRMQDRLAPTAGWFFVGLTRSWNVDFSPRSSREYIEAFTPLSVYAPARLLPFGKFVPFDPAVRVGEVIFGTDKIAHFFTNGARYHVRFVAEKARGRSDDDAIDAAIEIGVREESGILGRWASGIFSFADLQANQRGLAWYRSLCEGTDPGLRLVDGRWVLRPFSIAEHVDPCWDEAFEPSSFADDDAHHIRRAVSQLCPRFEAPESQRRWRSYSARGCPGRSRSHVVTRRLLMAPPDPLRTWIGTVCTTTIRQEEH
jgi:hypothetical protein